MWSIGCVLYESLTGGIPFDERSLCRLFLLVACKNEHQMKNWSKNLSNLPDHYIKQFNYVTDSLLKVEPADRMTPEQFYQRASEELAKVSSKSNVRHRLRACDKSIIESYSKSCMNFGSGEICSGSSISAKWRQLRPIDSCGLQSRRAKRYKTMSELQLPVAHENL